MLKTYFISISLVSVMCFFMISACHRKIHQNDSEELAGTDRFYSALSAEKGMNTAFLAMFDSAGVILRANHPPIEGYAAIRSLLMSESDSTFILSWEPSLSKISASGDMGYTYGTYKIVDRATDSLTGEGTYATVWQKQSDGKWKALLDTGNSGLKKK